jgi:hypothetical protein
MPTYWRRSVSYNKLEGGIYVFRVIGSNDDSSWNREGASVKIIIPPPPGEPGGFNSWW